MGEMMERMSSAEYHGWIAYNRMEPIGEFRADLRSAVVASTGYNIQRGKNSPSKSPKDFMPIYSEMERKRKEGDPAILEQELIQHFQTLNRTRKE